MSACTLALVLLRLSFCDPVVPETQLLLGDSLIALESEWTSVVDDAAPLRATNAIPGYGLNEIVYWETRIEQLGARMRTDKVVVSLGTNDASLAEPLPDYEQRVHRFMQALSNQWPAATVYWFMPSQTLPDDFYPPSAVAAVNSALFRAQQSWPNLFLVPTTPLLDGHPERLHPDGVHLTAQGARAFRQQVPVELRSSAPSR
jgi:lysophospholipase L1-like esterase